MIWFIFKNEMKQDKNILQWTTKLHFRQHIIIIV